MTFYDHLTQQLHTFRLTEDQFEIADFLIGNLDEDGYLRRELQAIVDDMAFSQNIYTDVAALKDLLENYIQKLDQPASEHETSGNVF